MMLLIGGLFLICVLLPAVRLVQCIRALKSEITLLTSELIDARIEMDRLKRTHMAESVVPQQKERMNGTGQIF
jgi:hypothetical protein